MTRHAYIIPDVRLTDIQPLAFIAGSQDDEKIEIDTNEAIDSEHFFFNSRKFSDSDELDEEGEEL